MITLACSDSVDALLRRVVRLVEGLGLEVFSVIDHNGEAAEVGLTMPDTKLVIFGSPRGGTPLMLAHPLIALDLPLKVLLWENTDRCVFVTYNAPDYFATRYELSEHETVALRVVETVARTSRPVDHDRWSAGGSTTTRLRDSNRVPPPYVPHAPVRHRPKEFSWLRPPPMLTPL